ncbi:MAG: T9SS type A sorting domain-containing protein [Cyclobacteriaceae bacterium]|nr:T9SS type A sorting domain-containing protein [Cyclobacteriaceae bacterium]
MKRFYFLLVLVLTGVFAKAQNITQLEYFIDTDPGYGNATNVAVTPAAALNDFTFNVPLTSVSNGFHTLYVRVKNANNKWSIVQNRPFVKLALPANIGRVEYFIDTDPGYGNGVSVPFTPGASLTDLTFNVPLTSVSDGLHTLYVRVRDANNKWSIVQNRTFVKIPAAPNITQIEYYVDTDPGLGNGTSVPFTPAPVLTDLNFSVNVSALSNGNHKLYVRVKNALGRWSSTLSQDFSVCNLAAPVATAATNVTTTGFVANWNAVAGATSYEVNASGDDFVNFSTATTTNTFANAINMPANTTVKYRVRAIGATCTSAYSNIISVTTLPKQDQTITFGTIPDKTLGSAAFTLSATASSGLTVSYVAGNNMITVNGSSVSLVSAGRTSITANQTGNTAFNAATPITQSFCVKPAKPTIALSAQHSATVVLTSSSASGNQWFKNGVAITGANSNTLNASEPAIYQVQVTVDDCVSEISNEMAIVITGVEPAGLNLFIYPNPVDDVINLMGIKNLIESKLTDMSGRAQSIEFKSQGELYQADVQGLSSGVYLLMIRDEFTVKHIRFNKK